MIYTSYLKLLKEIAELSFLSPPCLLWEAQNSSLRLAASPAKQSEKGITKYCEI